MEMTVPGNDDPVRLDRFLKREATQIPFSALFKLLRKGKIKVNGESQKDHKRFLHGGDVVTIEGASPEDKKSGFSAGDIPVLYEDACLLVLDKPRGLAVHSGKGTVNRTLIDQLEAGSPNSPPQLVHRLDKYTSGAIVVAKDRETAGRLGESFRLSGDRQVHKLYLAVSFGTAPPRGVVRTPLDGRQAVTHYAKLNERSWRTSRICLLEVEILTGRTHQIRRHLAGAGLPVAGDEKYGNWELNRMFFQEFRIREYLLHSWRLAFRHPGSGELMSFSAPVPKEILMVFPDFQEPP